MIYDDLRVVDTTTSIAGAYCAKLLTDLGADVVCVEPPGGHPLRAHDHDGALFSYLRTSQRSASGDPSSWIEAADIVLLGATPPPADERPDRAWVSVSITALGNGGPDDGLELPEEVLQARSGSLSNHGHMGQTPLTVGGHLGEYVTGTFGALGACTAWRRAQRTGVAEHVDVSMLEAMQMTMVVAATLSTRFPGGRPGTFRFVMIPGNEPTGDDRYVGITTVTAQQWYSLLKVIGRDDLLDDEQLATMLGRFVRADEVNGMIRAFTTAHTADELVELCAAARIPAGIVGNGAELPRVPQLVERDVYVKQPGEQWLRPRAPFRFHGVRDREMTPAPAAPGDDHTPWSVRTGGRPGGTSVAAQLPFAGVRILDFTAFWAGPVATSWFAALGADVIKVESMQRPDGIRFTAAVRPSQDPQFYEQSPVFASMNLNKRGITLDLSNPEGVDLARRLVERCDVVAENFTPRVLESFGLGYDAVRAIRPDAVMLRMPAFGLSGPWRDRPGFAQTMEQLTGMAWVTGYEGGPPIIAGGVVDPTAGMHAALAVVAALAHRDRTGEGQLVEMPLIEVAAAVTGEQVVRYAIDGVLLGRRGEGGVYRGTGDDEWVAVDRDRDPMSPDERARWCITRDAESAARELLAQGIPAAAMIPAYLTLDDAQMRARNFFETVEHPVVGVHDYPTWPTRFSAGPERFWHSAAPTLGQHNDAVLRDELGLTDDDLARLHAAHVIGNTPRA
ncbi:MAG: putative acyl-CoA transferase/carnitine dehydratase [Actinomycetia bacterium]|nr:putative acyl-CoA transferase/carnitine dehydratase [Actinomycetes bacterium]